MMQENKVETSRQERMEWIDFLRGLAMILVLLQHSNPPYGNWILAFHMPLFFLLSGYLEGLREKNVCFRDFVVPKLRRLMIPYFLFEICNLLLWMLHLHWQGLQVDIGNAALSILMCTNRYYAGFYGRLWFWPCLLVCEIYFYGIRKLIHGNRKLLWPAGAMLLGISVFTVKYLPFRLPMAADTAFLAAMFFILGYGAKTQIRRLMEQSCVLLDMLICTAGLTLLGTSVKNGGYYLMFENIQGPVMWSLLGAVSGCAAFLILEKWMYALLGKIPYGKTMVLWYGTNSLAAFPVHMAIKTFMVDYLVYILQYSGIGILMRLCEYSVAWYVVFPAMLIGCVPVVKFLTAAAPWMVGKFPSRGQKRADIDKKGIIG